MFTAIGPSNQTMEIGISPTTLSRFHEFLLLSLVTGGYNVIANLGAGLLTRKIKKKRNSDCLCPAHRDSGPQEEKCDGIIHCLL